MTPHDFRPTLAEMERAYILETLNRCDGNRTRTAKLLDISVRGLRSKLQSYAREGVEVTPAGRNEDWTGHRRLC